MVQNVDVSAERSASVSTWLPSAGKSFDCTNYIMLLLGYGMWLPAKAMQIYNTRSRVSMTLFFGRKFAIFVEMNYLCSV